MGAGITILQSGGGYAPIEVANYAALPPVGTSPGTTYAVLASQGTSWLLGFLGGTYYPAGFYYDATTEYLYTKTPYQANQTEVDAGINDDKFVTPKTFIQGLTNWFTNSKLLSVLGFTPVPNSRTINGYDLTSNRTLTSSDVGAVASNAPITAGTYHKVTVDTKGLVTSGEVVYSFPLVSNPRISNATTGGTSRYVSFSSGAAVNSSEAVCRIIIPVPVTFKYFYINTSSSQPATGSSVFNVLKNGVATGITITIAAGSGAGVYYDITNSVSFSGGDAISLEWINNGLSTSCTVISFSLGTI